jgi:RNA polymerase sigma factor (sigma-70 family)
MKSNSDRHSAISTYLANVHPDSCVGEFPVPDVERLYKVFRTSLFRRAFALVQDHSAAEDLLQEAFLRLVWEVSQGGPIRSALKWTHKVLRNIALNHIDHRQVVSNVVLGGVDLESLGTTHQSPTAEQSLISQERRAALETALARLSSGERKCLLLFADGASYQQIAKKQQIPYGAAVASIRRGLRRIRKEMVTNGHE